jgi:hypothetical protein
MTRITQICPVFMVGRVFFMLPRRMPTSKGGALELWRGVEEVEGEGTSTMAITDTYS